MAMDPAAAQAPAPGAPAEGAPPVADDKGGGENQFVSMVSNINNGLAMLIDVIGSSGVDDQGAQKLRSIAEAFGQTIDQIMQKQGGGGGQPPGAPGEAPMESGGNPNARQLGPQG